MGSRLPPASVVRRRVRALTDGAIRAVVRPRGRERVTGVVEDVGAYVAERGAPARFEALRPATEVVRTAPRHLDGATHPVLESLRTHTHPAVFRARLPGARIAGDEPLVLTDDRRALLQSTFDREQLDANAVMHRRLHPAVARAGAHVCLLSQWSTNYFHWMLDTLPRLALLDAGAAARLPVIVPDGLGATLREALTLAGIPDERVVAFDGTQFQIEELAFPSLVGRTGHPPAWALAWLREHLVPEVPAGAPRRRLYVTREDASWRRVVNDDAVAARLAARGFELLAPGMLSLREQLEAFAAADAIVGAHGAGLVNTFAARDATLVELLPETWVNGCYYALAAELRLPYWFLVGAASGRHDQTVDLDALERTLDAAGL